MNTLKYDDLGVEVEMKCDLTQGAVYLTVDKITVKIPIETFFEMVDQFPILADGGYI